MKGKRMALAAAVVMFGVLPLHGDVIYLKSGNVLVVEKAWQEGDLVKYETASGLQTVPLSSVKRLQVQKATPSDPSRNQPTPVVVLRGQGMPASPSPVVKPASKPAADDARARARSTRYQ